MQLRAENLEAFQAAFAAHATAVLGSEELRRTERIDAMVGGAGLGLDLAEELQQLAPFGMGNPGVRLLVPSARVRDVRTMGEGKHARFSLHSGAHRALGVAFGRASLGVGEDDPVDAAVRLEVNRWNGSVEPRLVLRELYPREAAAEAADEAWWQRFEAELAADPERGRAFDRIAAQNRPRRRARWCGRAARPAAVVGELASAGGGEVLAVVACAERRVALAGERVMLADAAVLEAEPGLAERFEHVVFVDPPQFAARRAAGHGGGGLCPPGLGRGRAPLRLRDARRAAGPARDADRDLPRPARRRRGERRGAARGAARQRPLPRSPVTAARCLRVLGELELVRGTADGGGGRVGVVSSEGTELERSPAYRAYGARHQEALRYLERRKNP